MKDHEAQALLKNLVIDAERACKIARVAASNKKSLEGTNPYGNRFHAVTVSVTTTEGKVRPLLNSLDLQPGDLEKFNRTLRILKSTDLLNAKQRADALRELQLLCQSVVLPKIESIQASPIPANEHVLPMSVVNGTRGYIERVVLQANGTYERQWFDACCVMIRRLVETLIIEVYEAKGKASEIKDGSGNFQMLSHLVKPSGRQDHGRCNS